MPQILLSQPRLGDEEIDAAVRVLRSGQVAQGAEVAAFEDEFAALSGARHCVAVNTGTSALWLSLLALGVGVGDEVIVPSFTFAATAAAVRLTGAQCVFADIDPDTFCLDPAAAKAAITSRTAAIVAVHLYGRAANLTTLTAVAARHRLALLEDAAQAHAATDEQGRPVGTLGVAAAFSFYPTKNATSVEGGMITTGDPELAGRLRLLRNHGMPARYVHDIVGTNARQNDVFAAIGRVQLRRLPAATDARRRNAAVLDTALCGLDGLVTPHPHPGHVYHQYTVRVTGGLSRDELVARLSACGIGTGVYYPVPLHRSRAYRNAVRLPHTDLAAAQVLSLPVHPGLRLQDLHQIAGALAAVLAPIGVAA